MERPVNIARFLKTGLFGPVRYPADAAQIVALFGEPPVAGGKPNKHKIWPIWRYGDVEFYFDPPTGQLHTIFSDHEGLLSGEAGLRIEPWGLAQGMRLSEVVGLLDAASIGHDLGDQGPPRPGSHADPALELVTEGQVVLSFHGVEAPSPREQWALRAVSYHCPVRPVPSTKQLHMQIPAQQYEALGALARQRRTSREDIVREWIAQNLKCEQS